MTKYYLLKKIKNGINRNEGLTVIFKDNLTEERTTKKINFKKLLDFKDDINKNFDDFLKSDKNDLIEAYLDGETEEYLFFKKHEGKTTTQIAQEYADYFNKKFSIATIRAHMNSFGVEYISVTEQKRKEKNERRLNFLKEHAKDNTLNELVTKYNKKYKDIDLISSYAIIMLARENNILWKGKKDNLSATERLNRKRTKVALKKGKRYNVYDRNEAGRKEAHQIANRGLEFLKADTKTLFFRHKKGFIVTFPNHNLLTEIREC